MPSLHLRGLTYAHTSAVTVFDDVTLDVASDDAHPTPWVGVVGPNGAGKTTLLRLVAGELAPTSGHLDVQASVRPHLVAQDVDALTDDVLAFAWTWDGVAQRLRRRLALDPDDLDASVGRGWSALSPGQRKRWQIAAALACGADVLLLDEPTNHLDARTRHLVVDALARFEGLGLIVSHDVTVLAQLASRTLRVHHRSLELHAGSYEEASARWRAVDAAERDAHDRAERRLRHERRVLAEVRRDRHGAEAGPRRERRTAGANQPDAREAGRRFAQRKAEAALARRVGQMNSRVARAEAARDGIGVERELGRSIGFHHTGTGRPRLAAVRGEVPHAGGQVWLREVNVVLGRGDRVHVTGANGAGKTTLLRAILHDLDRRGEVVAHLAQELEDPRTEVQRVRALDPGSRGRVLGTVAALGVDPDQVLVTDRPSPGEARKLVLARALSGDASVVVLDEPTNHLDLPSIERLRDALIGWPGALLLVSHDDRLAATVTTARWTVGDGRVVVDQASDEHDTGGGPG